MAQESTNIYLRGSDGARALNAFDDFLNDNPVWVTLLVYIGIGIGGLACIICSGILIRRRCNARKNSGFVANPYAREWSQEAGGATLVRKNVGKASPALADFMKHNPAAKSDAPPVPPASTKGKPSGAEMAAYSKRVSTNMTGQDYGRLDAETKERLRSVRMEGNLMPIGVAKPSAKALKMLGVEEEAIQRPFDDDIQTRMERVAKGAGGGLYSPGLATARLGGQIAQGFKERRTKQLEKAAERKQREEQRRAELEFKRASVKAESQKSKPPPPPPASTKPVVKPGPDKLQAFLSSTSAVHDEDEEDAPPPGGDDEDDDDEDDEGPGGPNI